MEKKELQTTTKNASLTILRPEAAARELAQVRTTKDALAIAETFPSLSALGAQYGRDKIENVMKLYLIDLCENVNLKRPLTEVQIDNIAREIVTTYYALTIADIHVIFRKAKTGEYGALYESLDMPKVITWFREYFNQRCSLAAEQSENNRVYDKGGNITPARMSKYFNELENRVSRGRK